MAVCEIWDVKGRLETLLDYAKNPEKTRKHQYTENDLQALRDVMDYVTDCNKTVNLRNIADKEFFVTGINCDIETARDEMMITKAQFGDEKEIVCFHGFQSFREGEVTPETAHEIGVKLAEHMWGDRFQVVVGTHLDTKCYHNHFVINSTSFADGKRYHDNKKNLAKIRALSDALCRQYRLSVIENPKGRKKPYALYMAEKAGLPTRENLARIAIDDAISRSYTLQDFSRLMQKAGYEVSMNPGRKYWTIKGSGWDRAKRIYRLGDEYTNERLVERIRENSYLVKFTKLAGPQAAKRCHVPGSKKGRRKVGGLRGLYLHYCYRLGFLPKKKNRPYSNVHRLLRDDLMKLEQITKETRLLCREGIDTMEQLFSFEGLLSERQGQLLTKRKLLYAKSRKAIGAEKEEIKEELNQVTDALWKARKEAALCNSIAARVGSMKEKLSQIKVEENRGKGERENVQRRRSGRPDRPYELAGRRSDR